MNNFLQTFGYLIIRNAFNLPQNIENLFDDACEHIIHSSLRSNPKNDIRIFGAIENYSPLIHSLEIGIDRILKSVFNESVYYWGSDFSTFRSNSLFHRDMNSIIPFYKMNIYLDGSYGQDQNFLLIPGSHRSGDSYSQSLSKICKWPESAGLNVNLLGGEIDFLNNTIQTVLPAVSITLNRGDVVIFDQRLLHAVNGNKLRRLIALTFVPDQNLFNFVSDKSYFSSADEYLNFLHEIRSSTLNNDSHVNNYKITMSQLNMPICESILSKYCFFNLPESDYFERSKKYKNNNFFNAFNHINPFRYKL
jgi:hypothetical protein